MCQQTIMKIVVRWLHISCSIQHSAAHHSCIADTALTLSAVCVCVCVCVLKLCSWKLPDDWPNAAVPMFTLKIKLELHKFLNYSY
jgi:hypothetical protein